MSDNADDAYGGPWIVENVPTNPGHFLTVQDIAAAVTSPGRDKGQIAGMIRHYLKSGYLHPFKRESAGRKAWLFLPCQVLVAEVLLRMGEFGISDADATTAAWNALTIWRHGDARSFETLPRTPGLHVIYDYEAGARDWTLELWLFRHADGRKVYDARIAANQRGEGTTLRDHAAGGFVPRAVFAVDLIDFLDQRHALLFPRKVN